MPSIEELAGAVPDKEQYRVTGVGITYRDPVAIIGPDGQAQIVYQWAMAGRGEVVNLTEWEANRLAEQQAVKPADEARSYDEQDDDELEAETVARGIDVRGSAIDGTVRREDRINALTMWDQGATSGISRGTTTVPGGVALSIGGTSDLARTESTVPEGTLTAPTGAFDPAEADVNALAEHIASAKLNAEETVTLAKNDPELAAKVLEAEQQVTGRDARATVEARLQRIINQAENPEDPEAGLSDEQTGG